MKKQISFPIPLLFSAMIACFLFGAIVGTLVTYILINPGTRESSGSKSFTHNFILPERAWVKEVIDADTITVMAEQQELRIRFLGIDAPENKVNSTPSYYAQEAYNYVKNLIEGKVIILKWDAEYAEERPGAGASGRLRAFAYIGNTFINAELIRQGFASVYRRQQKSIPHIHYQQFEALETEARNEKRGIWNTKNKETWESEHNLSALDNPVIYIADDQFFHRPECPKVEDIKFKRYYYQREKAMKDAKCCPICKP